MSYELRLERMFDASPEVVFDAFVDPENQAELHGSGVEGWTLSSQRDRRSRRRHVGLRDGDGGPSRPTSRCACSRRSTGRTGGSSPTPLTSTEWDGRTVESEMTITFEEQGRRRLTMVQTGFETEELRDDFLHGWPAYLGTLVRVVAPGVEEPGQGDVLKARHDT